MKYSLIILCLIQGNYYINRINILCSPFNEIPGKVTGVLQDDGEYPEKIEPEYLTDLIRQISTEKLSEISALKYLTFFI